MKIRTLIQSRLLLIPAAVFVGFAAGVGGALYYVRGMTTASWANQAVVFANTAALIDSSKHSAAREQSRQYMAIALESFVLQASESEARKYSNALRNVSTYLSAVPGIRLTPKAQNLLRDFPPMTGTELDASYCKSGICELAKRRNAEPAP